MARTILFGTLTALFLGACLAMSPGMATAAKPCKKECKPKVKACILAAKDVKITCIGSAADKAAKKTCKVDFKTAKKACKAGCPDVAHTPPSACSPSGAFLDVAFL